MKGSNPLILDLRAMNLLDKPGEWTKLDESVPAPEDLRIEMIGVPAGSPLHLSLQLESVVEGIYVSGSVRATAEGEDARTLEHLELPLNVAINELYVYEREPEDEDSYAVEHGTLDLDPAIRDAVVMALPFRPLAQPDHGEFNYTVGEDLEPEEDSDPRWSALRSLLEEEKES